MHFCLHPQNKASGRLESAPPGASVLGDLSFSTNSGGGGVIEKPEMWVPVGGSWRDEDNVCGYWRFSDSISVAGGLVGTTLEDGKQVHCC